jgi:diadenosine tetraphosphate (Ap4A) HIT family hydrolase
MENCCRLKINPFQENRVVYETSNFFVCSSLGSMGIEGYVLLVPKEHYEGMGRLPAYLYKELEDLTSLTRARLTEAYGQRPIIFEHGPKVGKSGWGGGTSIDHAHFHFVPGVDITFPFATSLFSRLQDNGQFYRVDRTEGLKRSAEILEQGRTSYVMLEPDQGKRFLAEVGFPGESQWLRKLVASQVGTSDWNWRLNPDVETALRTAEFLRKKFS